ncbi:hypothetical protein GYA25_03540 [Candidatus Woesearchaeota archaeon]|nr:hypothetical protein [Candidatus Woesearchaeota archaeon]
MVIRKYQGVLNNLRGRLFELAVHEIVKKSGFETEIDRIESDQFILDRKTGKKKKEIVGRAGKFKADIIGKFKINFPFSYPILLIGECKYLNKKIKIDIARYYLGIYTDVSQFPRIDIKNFKFTKYEQIFSSYRYNYVPVIFSLKGFEQKAQAFLWAHGISFISYENSPLFDKLNSLLENFWKEVYKQPDIKKVDFSKITDINDIKEAIPDNLKKINFDKKFEKINRYLNSINSFIGLLDNRFVINLIANKKKLNRGADHLFFDIVTKGNSATIELFYKKESKKPFGFITLPTHFYKQYQKYSEKCKKDILQSITLFYEEEGITKIQNIKLVKKIIT